MEPQLGETMSIDILDTAAAGPRAIRGSSWRIVGYLGGLLLSVLATALLFRHLGRSQTGRYTLAISLVTIVAGLSDLGLTSIGVRELSVRDERGRIRIARSIMGLRIVTSTVGVLLVAAFAAGVGDGSTLVAGVLCAGLGVLLQSCQSTLAMSLVADMRSPLVAGFDFLRVVLTSGLVIALVAAGATLLPFLAVSIPVGLIVLAGNARVVRGRVPLLPSFAVSEWLAILKGAIPFTLATAAATLYSQLAVVIVSLIASAGALGDFSLSVRTIQLLLVLPNLAVSAALPVFARAARDDRARLAYGLGRTYEVSLLLGVWVALGIAVGAPIAVTVFGRQFTHAVPLLAIQGVGLGASFVGAVWSTGLVSLARYRVILMINLGALTLGSVLIATLVSVNGAHGAAIATASWEAAAALLSGIALVRVDRQLRPPMSIVPKVAVALALATATTALSLPVLVSVVVASATYLAAVVALRAVPQEVYDELRRLRRSRA